MTIGKNNWQYIPEELAFQSWYELGSLAKAQAWFKNEGYRNPHLDTPPTRAAIQAAAYRWVLKNTAEARIKYQELDIDFALDDELWNQYLVKLAQRGNYLSKAGLRNFLDEHDLWNYYDGDPIVDRRQRNVTA